MNPIIKKISQDPKTTVAAIVGLIVTLTAIFGFEIPNDIQSALSLVFIFIIGILAKDTTAIPPPGNEN